MYNNIFKWKTNENFTQVLRKLHTILNMASFFSTTNPK
jgi:hypothetical protein